LGFVLHAFFGSVATISLFSLSTPFGVERWKRCKAAADVGEIFENQVINM